MINVRVATLLKLLKIIFLKCGWSNSNSQHLEESEAGLSTSVVKKKSCSEVLYRLSLLFLYY